jgi:hypothetical protein
LKEILEGMNWSKIRVDKSEDEKDLDKEMNDILGREDRDEDEDIKSQVNMMNFTRVYNALVGLTNSWAKDPEH